MMAEKKNKAVIWGILLYFLGFSLWAWTGRAKEESVTERRKLQQLPEWSIETVVSGEFMQDFEAYALDQFPARDRLRQIKGYVSHYLYGQKDDHGIYIADGYAVKMEYPLNQEGVIRATERFQYVYDTYMAETDVKLYFCLIPDKNYFLAEQTGHLFMDYPTLFTLLEEKIPKMKHIDIADLLEIEDYYRTDIHWKQERLLDVAEKITTAMGRFKQADYEIKMLSQPFYGVYTGQTSLPLEADALKYVTSPTLEQSTVYDFENQRSMAIYDKDKAKGRDPYEMFLSGSLSLIQIKNPLASAKRELVIFRDSFGSSLAPLLVEGYSMVTLVDLRYIHPDLLGRYLTFDKQDVLFLYSTSVLNQGETIK